MKRFISLIITLAMLGAMFTFAVPASAEALPANTVIADQRLSGADGTSVDITIGDKTYSAVIGTTAFKTVAAALDALPAGGTLLLAPGEYSESVTVKKDVTILGPKAGIDPNVRGANKTDDWTRNPKRGEGEAVLTTSWHIGMNAPANEVYDCHNVTIDGIAITGAGMLRSNYGVAGNITLNYKNFLVYSYTTKNNGPIYCYSYYPDRKVNDYSRILNAENFRFEGQSTAPGFNLDVDGLDASGIYFDSASTNKFFTFITMSSAAQSGVEVTYTVRDSMFRQKTNQVLNCNVTPAAGGNNFNANVAKCAKVTVNITGNAFVNNDSGAASNNNIIVPQIQSENVYFNIIDNVFMQEKASANLIAIHGATGALPLGEKFKVSGNKFINIPTALNISKSTTAFDLSGNYFELGGEPAKPVVVGPDATKWWYMDSAMTKSSDAIANVLDGEITVGKVDKTAKTLTDSVDSDSYEVKFTTSSYNEMKLYSDKELTKELTNPVKLYSETNIFYIKIMSASREKYEVYTATVKTGKPDKLSFDIENELRWLGRTYSVDGTHFFNWSSSGFEFSFKGSGVTAEIASNAPGGSNTAYIKIYIDGVEQKDVALTKTLQTVTLAKDLDPNATHTVKVLKRTNARSSSAALISLKLTDGEKLAPPAEKERLIEFVGDSITVGYATVVGNQTAWSTATEDSTKTYSAYIADAFGADHNVIAVSGRGVVRNYGNTTERLIPAIYGKVDDYNLEGVDYDFKRQADVIVINLGTNDASGTVTDLTIDEFKAGLKTFLLDVRAKNPNAEIIYAYGMLSQGFIVEIKSVVNALRAEGDDNITYLKLDKCKSSEQVLGHPTAESYIPRGDAIIELIEELTGWKAGEAPEDTLPPETTPADEVPASEITTEQAAPETEPDTPAVTEPEKGGCGASAMPAAMLAGAVAAAVVLKKKKEF